MRRLTATRRRRRQRGLSLVELMIGVALGLFITAGAATLFISNLMNSRRMLVEARMEQDLRAAADLIARDLRRAGYWSGATQSTFATASGTTIENPYRAITFGSDWIDYAYTPIGPTCALVGTACSNEQYKFDVATGALRLRLDSSGAAQAVTDPNVMTMTIEPIVSEASTPPIPLGASCSTPCTSASYANCPTVDVRTYTIALVGTSPATSKDIVQRRLTTTVRVRNDMINGNCP